MPALMPDPSDNQRTLTRLTRLAFGAAVLVLLVNALLLYTNTRELADSSGWVKHTQQVLLCQQQFLTALVGAEVSQQAYLMAGDPKLRDEYTAAKQTTNEKLAELTNLVKDNPDQTARATEFRTLTDQYLALLDDNVRRGPGNWNPAVAAQGRVIGDKIAALKDQMTTVEDGLLENRERKYDSNYRGSVIGIGVGAAVALATVIAGFYLLNRDTIARRKLALETAQAAEFQKKAAEDRELAAAEQERLSRYNTLILNSTGEGIFGTDPTGRLTFINDAAGAMLGVDPPTTAVGVNLIDLVQPLPVGADISAPPDPTAVFPAVATARTGEPARGDDFTFRRASGARFPVEYSAFPIQDRGRVAGAVVAFADITKRKVAEKELSDAKQLAEEANVAKSQFLANMSHELRTPLNAVILYSELLQEESADRGIDDFGPDLEKIRTAGKHLLSLVNGVLDLSKIEAGKMDLYLETFDIAQMVADVAGTVEPLVNKKNNKLVVNVAETAGVVHGDLTKTRQILFNFVSNAAKFTENGTVTLSVARSQRDGREVVTYQVTDSGIGMTPEQLGKLFKPFSQADESTTRKYGGTGLGLTICRRFAEMMGGDISVDSVPDRGTTFVVHIPTTIGIAPTGPHGVALTAPVNGAVLVIDDNPDARQFVVDVLAKEGLQAVTAADGEEGLRLAKSFKPAAIFLDVIMPKLDGWAVLSALKRDPGLAEVPVIMLTIAAGKDLSFTLGAAEYLTKPVEQDELVKVIRKYCEGVSDPGILVVDDDDTTRHAVRRALTRSGFLVDEAANGRQALDLTTRRRYSLVILDLVMPELDGFGFLKEFRHTPNGDGVPVVIVTSKDLTNAERERLTGQVEAVLQKGGYSLDELQAEIHRLAGRLQGKEQAIAATLPAASALPTGL